MNSYTVTLLLEKTMSEKTRAFKTKDQVLQRIDTLIGLHGKDRLCRLTTPIVESEDLFIQDLLELFDSGDNDSALNHLDYIIDGGVSSVNFYYRYNDRDLKRRAVYMPLSIAKVFVKGLYPDDVIINYEERFKNMSAYYKSIPYLSITIPYMPKKIRAKLEIQ